MSIAAPQFEHVADLAVGVAKPTVVSPARRVIGILGGEVTGPKIRGKVMAGGADFQVIRADHTTDLEARYVIETDSAACILNRVLGYASAPAQAG